MKKEIKISNNNMKDSTSTVVYNNELRGYVLSFRKPKFKLRFWFLKWFDITYY